MAVEEEHVWRLIIEVVGVLALLPVSWARGRVIRRRAMEDAVKIRADAEKDRAEAKVDREAAKAERNRAEAFVEQLERTLSRWGRRSPTPPMRR